MNQDLMKDKTDLELDGVISVENAFSTLIEKGSKDIVNFCNSNKFLDIRITTKELGAELSGAFEVLNRIYKIGSIPDRLFMRKIECYCAGLVSIPISKREKYVAKVGKKSFNKDTFFC